MRPFPDPPASTLPSLRTASASNTLPTSAPVKATKPAQATAPSGGAAGTADAKKDDGGTATAEVTVSFGDETTSAGSTAISSAASGELYKINTDGFVETVRKFDREMLYAINGGRNGSILLSTGPQGRIYEYRNGELSLIATVPEKQIVSIAVDGNQTLITTTNAGAVYRMDAAPSPKAEFRSAAKDIERFSRFGHYRIEGQNLGDGHVAIAFRSGNTRTPDATWSNWSAATSAAEGAVDAPAGRYIQWRLTTPKPAADTVVDGVTVAFVNRNVAPSIDTVNVQEPAVVFINGSYPSSPQVVEATNPDEYGIFTSLDNARDRNDQSQGKKVYRKGYRTITWRAHDDNGDSLRYNVAFRRAGADRWLRLRDNLEESSINFDTSQLPDGAYQLRLIASDATDNPDAPLTDTKEGIEFTVDNTPPSIVASTSGDDVTIRVTDKASTVGRVEYSADAQKWIRLTPADGIADSSDETYHLKRSDIAGKFVIVRAVDSYYNVATESVTLP